MMSVARTSYPTQTLTAEKASTVDTGYTTVVSILRISFLGAILARSQTPPGFLGELPKAVRKQNDLHLIYRYSNDSNTSRANYLFLNLR